jgi:hypothetical protein
MSSFLLTSHNCDNVGDYNKIMSYYSKSETVTGPGWYITTNPINEELLHGCDNSEDFYEANHKDKIVNQLSTVSHPHITEQTWKM